jgi:hypothetical protein
MVLNRVGSNYENIQSSNKEKEKLEGRIESLCKFIG